MDSVQSPKGTVWFTLVMTGEGKFFVERHDDSPLAFLKERLKQIQPVDFINHKVNGVSLAKLVVEKIREIKSTDAPDNLTENLPPPPNKSDRLDDP